MKEQLISYETAKLAKKKGFGLGDYYIKLPTFYDEGVLQDKYHINIGKKPKATHLGQDTINDFEAHLLEVDNSLKEIVLAPTQALLQTWLRLKHNINITCEYVKSKKYWSVYIVKMDGYFDISAGFIKDILAHSGITCYENSLEKGLFTALEFIQDYEDKTKNKNSI